jgi:site-specific recombinase XerD
MATKPHPNGLPRGIRFSHRPDRPRPFFLHWTTPDGTRRSAAYADERSRKIAADALADKRADHGRDVMTFSPREWQAWREFRELIGNADPMQVGREWLATRQGIGGGGASGLTVRDAVKRYIEMRRAEETLSDDTWRHFNKHLTERFSGALGSLKLCDITADHIRAWLAALVNPRTGAPMEALTRKHHRKDVNTFLDRARREGWILRNPCEVVAPPSIDDGEVTVIPIADAVRFFEVNRDARATPRIALEAFGAVRYSTAGQIDEKHLNFELRGIEMPGVMHKSRKRKFRQGHPENLWAWLSAANAATWQMTPLQYREEKRAAFHRAGLRPLVAESDEDRETLRGLRNVWRHSFASYHLAAFKNMPLTGYLMQHQHTSTTEVYEGVATEADAKAFFSIKP